MNKAAIYHRPESEMAYLYKPDEVHIRLRTAKDDMASVILNYGDPYMGEYQALKMRKISSTLDADFYQAEVNVPTKRMSYYFLLEDRMGEKALLTDRALFPSGTKERLTGHINFNLPYFQLVDAYKAPDWVKETVWYQIFPERFANGDKSNDPENVKAWNPKDNPGRQDFYGGDLQGVIDHLDHLSALGVNGIYFTPIFKSPTNHKYDTEDYLEIDPHFGDLATFKRLVKEAHARGIRVMLDAVFNHIGDFSAQWQDVLKNQEHSKYADWFHVNSWPITGTESADDFEHSDNLSYDTYAFTPHMPKWNTANPEAKKHLLHVTDYWIRECDIDAWRLDVAGEVDHQFWKDFRRTCDAAKKDFYILGEIWHSSQTWLAGDEFSAVMNYSYMNAIIDRFVHQRIGLTDMVSQINAQLMLYQKGVSEVMFNVLDSHDTARLLTLSGEDKDLFCQVEAFTYMQPGSPCIYYGDEYGLTGQDDPDCRKPMPWEPDDQDLAMFDFFKQLVAFRKKNAGLLSAGEMDWCVINEDTELLQLQRQLGGERLIGTFNLGKKPVSGKLLEIQLSNLASAAGDSVTIEPKGFVISKG